jgi:hypothetical protein
MRETTLVSKLHHFLHRHCFCCCIGEALYFPNCRCHDGTINISDLHPKASSVVNRQLSITVYLIISNIKFARICNWNYLWNFDIWFDYSHYFESSYHNWLVLQAVDTIPSCSHTDNNVIANVLIVKILHVPSISKTIYNGGHHFHNVLTGMMQHKNQPHQKISLKISIEIYNQM